MTTRFWQSPICHHDGAQMTALKKGFTNESHESYFIIALAGQGGGREPHLSTVSVQFYAFFFSLKRPVLRLPRVGAAGSFTCLQLMHHEGLTRSTCRLTNSNNRHMCERRVLKALPRPAHDLISEGRSQVQSLGESQYSDRNAELCRTRVCVFAEPRL